MYLCFLTLLSTCSVLGWLDLCPLNKCPTKLALRSSRFPFVFQFTVVRNKLNRVGRKLPMLEV